MEDMFLLLGDISEIGKKNTMQISEILFIG